MRRFLGARGEGFYRLSFRTEDCDAAFARFDQHGVRYVDLSADGGQRIVLTTPKSAHGLMAEFIEARTDPTDPTDSE